jgi:hypothetical protein
MVGFRTENDLFDQGRPNGAPERSKGEWVMVSKECMTPTRHSRETVDFLVSACYIELIARYGNRLMRLNFIAVTFLAVVFTSPAAAEKRVALVVAKSRAIMTP